MPSSSRAMTATTMIPTIARVTSCDAGCASEMVNSSGPMATVRSVAEMDSLGQ